VQAAHEETALPASPRLKDVELPRTTDQLRRQRRPRGRDMAAADHRSGEESALVLRAHRPGGGFLAEHFPFAFNGVSGGDFAAAIAAGNPVIAKAHPLHAYTSQRMAEAAARALKSAGLAGSDGANDLQAEPRERSASGERSAHRRCGIHGRKGAGLKLKQAADTAGNRSISRCLA